MPQPKNHPTATTTKHAGIRPRRWTAPYAALHLGRHLVHDGLDEITECFPAADLAVLHLGGTRLTGGLRRHDGRHPGAELADVSTPRLVLPRALRGLHGDALAAVAFLAEAEAEAEAEAIGLGDRIVRCGHGEHGARALRPGGGREVY